MKRNPNGYGGIIELKGNRKRKYWVRITKGYRPSGSQIYETLGYFENRKEAMNCLAEYNRKPYDVKAKAITFKQLYDNWQKEHFGNITNSTQNCYKTARKYCKEIDNIKFADLRTIHLQRVIDHCPKYSIRKNIRILLNQLYKYGEKLDIVDKRYSKYIEIGKSVTVYHKTPFTPEEEKAVFDNIDNIPYLDTCAIMLMTGLRITELLEIKTENVHITGDERYMIGR